VIRLAVVLFLVVLVVVFGDLPGRWLFVGELQNSAHVPAFGTVAALLLLSFRRLSIASRWSSLTRYVIAVSVATAIGAVIELVQGALHRDMSLEDVFHDVLGALIGVGLMQTFKWEPASNRLRKSSALLACAALLTATFPVAWSAASYIRRDREFPILLQFTSPLDRYFLYDCAAKREFSKIEPFANEPALVVKLDGSCRKQIGLAEPRSDWRGYKTLRVEMENRTESRVDLTIRVEDVHHNQEYNDRFNRSFEFHSGERKVLNIPLADIESSPATRKMDMREIYWINIFAGSSESPPRVALYRIWLE
jgi:hypothetical protein